MINYLYRNALKYHGYGGKRLKESDYYIICKNAQNMK